jgi:hypothetical protein
MKGCCFSFYRWEEESEKKIHFICLHNDNVEGLLLVVALLTNEKTYTLVYMTYMLSVCYICLGLLIVHCIVVLIVKWVVQELYNDNDDTN